MTTAAGNLSALREVFRYCERLARECEQRAAYYRLHGNRLECQWFEGQAAGARVVQREVARMGNLLKAAVEKASNVNNDNGGQSPDRAPAPEAINTEIKR